MRRWPPILVLACAVLAYGNVLGHGFVAGDLELIVENPSLRRIDVLWTAFSESYWFTTGSGDQGSFYRPLVVLSTALDAALWGLAPTGFHATNVALHAIASGLTYGLACSVLPSRRAALIAAILFAVHPVHVHAVTYVSGRTSVLVSLFYVAGLSAAAQRRWRWTLAALVAALLSKESAATFPVALAGLLWLTRRSPPLEVVRAHARLLAGAVALVAAFVAARVLVLGVPLSAAEPPLASLPPGGGVLTFARIVVFHLRTLVAPAGLSYLPPFVPSFDLGDVAGWIAWGAIGALIAFVLRAPASWRTERACVAFVLLTLLPVSGVFYLDYFVKPNYAYLPSVGFSLLCGALGERAIDAAAARVGERRARGYAVVFGSLLGLAAVALTWAQSNHFRNTTALYRRVVALEDRMDEAAFDRPGMARSAQRYAITHFNLAQELARAGRCDEALPHYARTRRLTPRDSMRGRALVASAECHIALGNVSKAARELESATDLLADDPDPPLRLAVLLGERGEPGEAAKWLRIACERGSSRACAFLEGR